MTRPRFSLRTLSATVTAAMLLLSVAIVYLGVEWYAERREALLLATMPPEARQAYTDIDSGRMPDQEGLRSLVETLPTLLNEGNLALYLSVLFFGLLAAFICSAMGYFLARRITRPLEKLTSAVESLRGGDFAVRVPVTGSGASEVAILVNTFNALAAELENMERRLRFNTMAVAHELRTPLTIVQGTLLAIADGVFPLDRARVRSLLVQVAGLSRLVEDLRTLSLAASQKLITQRDRADLADEVQQVLDGAQPLLAEAGITAEPRLQVAHADIDSQRFRQGVLALVENACRYAAAGKVLVCETGLLGDREVFVRLLDRGPGLPADLTMHSVDVFWRGEPSRSRATGGSGLGLSIVQAIAKALGGRLEIANRDGGGASVTLVLPRSISR